MKLGKLLNKGRAIFLAYDQGIEHGPTDFNDLNVNPEYIMKIAYKGKFNAVVFQKGIAEKYYNGKVPLILKLNGKTNLVKGEPISTQVCSVEEAIKIGADAVGYTIYIGSEHEKEMFSEFGKIEEKAHSAGLPVIAWIYPRGKSVKNETSADNMAYSARVGLELGADIIKIKYNGNKKDLSWAVKSAGKSKVVIAGGVKKGEKKLIRDTYDIVNSGAAGLAIGRNIWQNKNPFKITEALKKIIFEDKEPENVFEVLG